MALIPATTNPGSLTRNARSMGYGFLDIDLLVTERKRFPRQTSPNIRKPINEIGLVWTVARQVHALDDGFFFHRTFPHNDVTLVPLRRFKTAREVTTSLKERALAGEQFAIEALSFIQQQDEFGFQYAWDPLVRNFSHALQWYKDLKARQRGRPGTRMGPLHARLGPRKIIDDRKARTRAERRLAAKLEEVEREWAGGRSIKAIEASIKRTEDLIAKADEVETRAYAAIEQAKEQMRVGREALEAYKRELKRAKFMSL